MEAKKSLPKLRAVFFTGGECFILRKILYDSIALATKMKLSTRCVSNASWATSSKNAYKKLLPARQAGLKEINFSTGDNHQRFVPFKNVVNASIEAAKLGIATVIVLEGAANAKFKMEDLLNDQRLKDFNKHADNPVKIIQDVWIPFHKDSDVKQEKSVILSKDKVDSFTGCDSMFANLGLDPYNKVVSCCGLTMEAIPEMKMGAYEYGNLKKLVRDQYNDFLKIWIWTDGPEKILYYASLFDESFEYPNNITHRCQACALIFSDKKVQRILKENWEKIFDDVMLRYNIKVSDYNKEIQMVGNAL
ncbi:hypothetical protein FD00_GL001634 [Liquorilactobacillus mali KCTC 3596 = DSM 20444]|uniref:Uncharacterized protein n=2 Tax=Liquorilactobacillus mali TaxID=1618 RepID=A0A0R2DYJ2_9LACO|nr:hypothetical protein FD00_GL001634 [Liquorilactobacillus mali KCTC 3596 = DSM 20444]